MAKSWNPPAYFWAQRPRIAERQVRGIGYARSDWWRQPAAEFSGNV